MSTRSMLTSGWEPTAATPRLLPVAPGLAKTYMKLFVNRLSYCEQSQYGDHRYHRPKHSELKTLAGRRAAMEMTGQKWGSLPHTDRTNEIYLELVKERRLPSVTVLTLTILNISPKSIWFMSPTPLRAGALDVTNPRPP